MRISHWCIRFAALILAAAPLGGRVDAQSVQPSPTRAPARVERDDATTASAEALFRAGCARLAAGEPAAAVALLARAAGQEPQRAEYAAKLVDAYVAAGPDGTPGGKRDFAPERELGADDLLVLAGALEKSGRTAAATALVERGRQRFPGHDGLCLEWVDTALRAEQWALALERARGVIAGRQPSPALNLRLAQAYFGLGKVLGAVEVREVADGRLGQFTGGWLLLERRGPRQFFCCPEASALNQLRRALDAGLDEPAAHRLHARIWQSLGKPQIGFSLLKSREAVLLGTCDLPMLETYAELALDADALDDFLRCAQRRASCEPQRRAEILADAYGAVAEKYGQRGDAVLYRGFAHRALELRPDDVDLMWQVAEAEWSAGHPDEAKQLYRRILERQPDHPRRGLMLERLAGSYP